MYMNFIGNVVILQSYLPDEKNNFGGIIPAYHYNELDI